MRKALVIGIDHYSHISSLYGCVNDSYAVKNILERHGDGSVNFSVNHFACTNNQTALNRGQLKDHIKELFKDDSEIALLYFAGHGHIEATGGYLCGNDCQRGDDGLSLDEVLILANNSKARNKIIILDSCHSGVAGNTSGGKIAELSEGMTILTASTQDQYASESNGSGIFTSLLVDALSGAAGNLVGDITPGSVYAHIDQSLGPWKQRPVFKTNVKTFVSLRKVHPPIDLNQLQRLTEFFSEPGYEYGLDPSYEPKEDGKPEGSALANPINTEKFFVLQKYNRVGLVVPVNCSHMWDAAIESKSCKLTALGEHYRKLVAEHLI